MADKRMEIFQTPNYCFDVDYGYKLAKKKTFPIEVDEQLINDYYESNMQDGQVKVRDNYHKVKVNHPVLFAWDPKREEYLLIDGNHRLKKVYKALKKGDKISLKAYYLNKTDSKKIIFTTESSGHGYISYSSDYSYSISYSDSYYSSSYS